MYKYMLFDADNTLLDFNEGEKCALYETLASTPLGCSDEVYRRYHIINDEEWKKLEMGKTTREKLRIDRFARLFDEFGFNSAKLGEITADIYIEKLAMQSQLFDGALEVVSQLSEKYDNYIITNGITSVQKKRFYKTLLIPFIKKLYISEEMGCAKPEKQFFDLVIDDIGDSDRKNYLVIGDSLSSDIRGAVNAGIDCCFFDTGNTGSGNLTPKYTVTRLEQLLNIL